ncbi:phosphoglycerate dehydrogenase [Bacteroidia bacterium]|nr:phosphoglycerate dehydrogenase [Bacteroidia bacterium]
MAIKKIYIADDFHAFLLNGLDLIGIEYIYHPEATRETIIKNLNGNANALLLRSKVTIDKAFLDETSSLEFIGRGGAGMDNIDQEACKQKGIFCFNAGEANAIAVAEHSLGVLLSLLRNITSANSEVRKRIWQREQNRGVELASLKVGIIGFGNTGSSFGHILSCLGSTVLAYDKYKKGFGKGSVKECGLKELFENADVISLHVPLNDDTKQWINRDFIQKFKKPIFLMNMSRGEIVCFKSVIEELEKCKIRGFGTDVLENEKLKTFTSEQSSIFELAASKNKVIFTPHIAGWTKESYRKISEVLLSKIKKYV